MKNVFKVLGVIALIAVIGFSMAACVVDKDRDDTDTALNGTWVKDSEAWKFKNGNFEKSVGVSPAARGFFTTKNNKLTIVITGIHGGSPEFAKYELESKWYSKDDFKLIYDKATDVQLDEIFQTLANQYSVTGTTFTWGTDEYTKE
jgi:hypothetical protein